MWRAPNTPYYHFTIVRKLLDVTEKGNAPPDPVVRCLYRLQQQTRYVSQVGAVRFLVHGTHVQFRVVSVFGVHGIDVHHWNRRKEDFWCGFGQPVVLSVPRGSVKKQTVYVDPFVRRSFTLFPVHPSHVVVDDDRVQRPPLVCSSHLLPHGRHEALRVEEPRHPEAAGSPVKDPAPELRVSLKQLRVPEPNGR